jgi:hypothetical protein
MLQLLSSSRASPHRTPSTPFTDMIYSTPNTRQEIRELSLLLTFK